MKWKNVVSNDKGAVLIGAIIVLVAVTAIGVTLITMSNFEVNMATNEKCTEEARYNAESCSVSGIKLIKMVSTQASEQGILGIPEGDNKILGITYAESESASSKEAEFAQKVLGTLDDSVCEDFELRQNTNIDAAANIRPLGSSSNAGTASNRQISGYSYGIGLGGAGSGGTAKWYVLASRGNGCNGYGRHVSYVRYKRVLGVPGGM
jgi:hypothetical protein